MLKQQALEAAIMALASKEGLDLNGQDKLVIRTRVSEVLAAKERHRRRMGSGSYQWRKPDRLRR